MRSRLASGATCLAFAVVLAGAGCGGDDEDKAATASGQDPSVEYQVARVVRSFLLAYAEGDSERACTRLTPEHQQAVARRQDRPSCARALSLERVQTSSRDLDRLRRARITKVAIDGGSATAEVTVTAADRAKLFTAPLRHAAETWQIAGDLTAGGLASGRAPTPPPGPPRDPEQESEIAAAFERYRRAIAHGDGEAACALQTPQARQSLVRDAIELVGGEREATRDFGGLDCEHITLGYQVPSGRIKRVVVDGRRGRLTLEGGAKYVFRKVDGAWKLDS